MATGFGDPLWNAEAFAWLQAFLHSQSCRYGSCARETFGSAGLHTGSPTCVQLPPFRLATTGLVNLSPVELYSCTTTWPSPATPTNTPPYSSKPPSPCTPSSTLPATASSILGADVAIKPASALKVPHYIKESYQLVNLVVSLGGVSKASRLSMIALLPVNDPYPGVVTLGKHLAQVRKVTDEVIVYACRSLSVSER